MDFRNYKLGAYHVVSGVDHCGGIAYLLHLKFDYLPTFYALSCLGLLAGITLAEHIRRKFGCSNFMAKLYG